MQLHIVGTPGEAYHNNWKKKKKMEGYRWICLTKQGNSRGLSEYLAAEKEKPWHLVPIRKNEALEPLQFLSVVVCAGDHQIAVHLEYICLPEKF